LLLSLADFENNKKKNQAAREKRRRNANLNFARELVDVFQRFDELSLAEEKVSELSDSCRALHEGITMTRDICKGTFEKFDVEALTAEPGAAMAPARFESVGEVEDAGVAAGGVAEVVRPGWIFEPRSAAPAVIRKAQVKVARQGPATPPPPK